LRASNSATVGHAKLTLPLAEPHDQPLVPWVRPYGCPAHKLPHLRLRQFDCIVRRSAADRLAASARHLYESHVGGHPERRRFKLDARLPRIAAPLALRARDVFESALIPHHADNSPEPTPA